MLEDRYCLFDLQHVLLLNCWFISVALWKGWNTSQIMRNCWKIHCFVSLDCIWNNAHHCWFACNCSTTENQLDCPWQRRTKHSPSDTSKFFLFSIIPSHFEHQTKIDWAFFIFSLNFSWNEWVTLPHLFSELPRTAMLAITILDCAGAGEMTVIGGTTISLFGKNGVFRQVNRKISNIFLVFCRVLN